MISLTAVIFALLSFGLSVVCLYYSIITLSPSWILGLIVWLHNYTAYAGDLIGAKV
jgi:hypothetical protein